jgi:glycosyltransferase involved in cell wall biosynthesis
MVKVLRSYNVRRPIEVLPTGIDMAAFQRFEDPGSVGRGFRKQWGIREKTKLLLFAGRIVKEKNIPFLYQVLKRVIEEYPDTVLLLAGDGPDRKSLQNQAWNQGLGANVCYCGYLTHRELIPAYYAADLFVFASLTETQGIVLTEAMACGTPAVAISALGVIDIMESGKGGFLVREDVEEFTDVVLQLLRNRQLYEKKSREALENAKLWSLEAGVSKLLGFYRELLESRAHAAV